ncbi:MAG: hypothetical protein OEV00_08140, partial [Acidobacteriota bacterium]|nr:hypothetical protein [Acidobacteriota bacterium]
MRNAIRNFGALMPAVALLATVMLLPAPARAAGESGDSEIPGPLKTAITYKLQDRIKEAVGQKNAQGKRFKRGAYSSRFEKVDDTTYAATVQIDTAFETSMQTERIRMILDVEGSAKVSVREELIEDTYTALYRSRGYSCYPFSSFAFDREGMKMSSGPGHVCEFYFNEEVNQVGIASDSLMYEYTLPEHLELIQPAHQYHTLKEILEGDHGVELVFDPEFLAFQCDGETCDEILTSSFKGLERIAAEARSSSVKTEPASMNSAMKRRVDKFNKDWNERFNDNPFHGFRRLDRDSHHFYNALAFRNDDDGVGIAYDNLDGYEVQFFVITGDQIDAAAIRGSIFGYYTEETLKNTSAYDLEQRDDIANREYEIYSVKGEVDAGIDDPEWVKAKIEFGVTVKDDLRELQFFIANAPRGDDTNFRRPSLQVNAVQMDGKDMTWIKTGAFGGLVIFPETVKAGETVYLTMDFATRAIRKYNVAFSQLARFGWMPFVRFGDFIEEFELTIRTPSQYKILGIGQKMEESVSGGVRTSHWSAESPVVFPSIIFGKYFSDDTGDKYKASKIDGTTVPVNVHVDEVSLTDWDIRTKQLRPIATQAAVSIDIYKDISGVDYPYGELNLVNDPSPALYGQA